MKAFRVNESLEFFLPLARTAILTFGTVSDLTQPTTPCRTGTTRNTVRSTWWGHGAGIGRGHPESTRDRSTRWMWRRRDLSQTG